MEYLKDELLKKSVIARRAGFSSPAILSQKIHKRNYNRLTVEDCKRINEVAINFFVEAIKEINQFNLETSKKHYTEKDSIVLTENMLKSINAKIEKLKNIKINLKIGEEISITDYLAYHSFIDGAIDNLNCL